MNHKKDTLCMRAQHFMETASLISTRQWFSGCPNFQISKKRPKKKKQTFPSQGRKVAVSIQGHSLWDAARPQYFRLILLRTKSYSVLSQENHFTNSRDSREMIINQSPVESYIFLSRAEKKVGHYICLQDDIDLSHLFNITISLLIWPSINPSQNYILIFRMVLSGTTNISSREMGVINAGYVCWNVTFFFVFS